MGKNLSFVMIVFSLLHLFFGCEVKKEPSPKQMPPAKVSHSVPEGALTTIQLTPEAQKRLGVSTLPIVEQTFQRRRTYGGEIILPPGQCAAVMSPLNGTLLLPENVPNPTPRMTVQKGQILFLVQPILAAEHEALTEAQRVQMSQTKMTLATLQIEVEQRVKSAKIERDAAEIEFNRAKKLFVEKAGNQQMVDATESQLKKAEQSLQAAQTSFAYLEKATLESDSTEITPIPLIAPISGILSNFSAVPGQTVIQGTPIVEISNINPLWLRVPVYVGQLREVAANDSVLVYEFGQNNAANVSEHLTAIPIAAPPSANPIAATVDLFYEIQQPSSWMRPGHKVAVSLPLLGELQVRTVPWSAVVFDIYGGSWIYRQVELGTYTRERVEVELVQKNDETKVATAILRRGPKVGTEIVVEAVAEIFGTEFGGAK